MTNNEYASPQPWVERPSQWAEDVRHLIRPIVTLIGFIIICFLEMYQVIIKGTYINDYFWALIGVIVVFWFGDRMLKHLIEPRYPPLSPRYYMGVPVMPAPFGSEARLKKMESRLTEAEEKLETALKEGMPETLKPVESTKPDINEVHPVDLYDKRPADFGLSPEEFYKIRAIRHRAWVEERIKTLNPNDPLIGELWAIQKQLDHAYEMVKGGK